jgi:iron complex outermembrane receptor protein
MKFSVRLVAGAAGSVLAWAAISYADVAAAQSTASQVQEVIVTGARAPRTVGGALTQVQVAKDVSIVTHELFERETPGSNAAQLINMLPGVNFQTEDPTGISSGDLRLHGQDGAHISILIDGTPVNDTGNYASYPGEYLIPEVTDHITVNSGATDVDSPTASALAGTVNIVSKNPSKTETVIGSIADGSYSYKRAYGELDSGEFGPLGTTSYIAYNYQDSDKYRGSGTLPRQGLDAAVYQPLSGKDFIKIAGTYVEERADFYYSASKANLAQFGDKFDYNQFFIPISATTPTSVPAAGGEAGGDTNFYALHPNPVNFGDVRGQSYFDLTDKLHFTFDPSYFYTLANGGGASAISECDARLKGVSGNCVDLNSNGYVSATKPDSVLLYSPSNTQTFRYGINTSLLYDLDNNNHFQLAYTLDHGDHRQTGDFSYVANGRPVDYFGSKKGYGPEVLTADGTQLENRNRFSIAKLNQVAFNYIGKFYDDRLHINLGLRAPFFERDLNQYCYTYNGSSQYCTDVSPATIDPLAAAVAASGGSKASLAALQTYIPGVVYNQATGKANLRDPFSQTFNFSKPLPNVGATYRLADSHLLYVTYAESFSAPKTDDLYTSSTELVKPESSSEYGVGYRYQTRAVTVTLDSFYELYRNRIVSSADPNDPTLSIDRNVGNVDIYGLDAQFGVKPTKNLLLYASMSLMKSDLRSNYISSATLNGASYSFTVPTKGKELVDTPDQSFAGRAQYNIGPVSLGLDGKYISSRYTSDVNDDKTGGYAVFNMDGRYDINAFGLKNTYFQVNVDNLLDRSYLGRIGTSVATVKGFTTTAANPVLGSISALYAPQTPYFYVGAPRTIYVSLHSAF